MLISSRIGEIFIGRELSAGRMHLSACAPFGFATMQMRQIAGVVRAVHE
jgi:hypothetical protein